MSDLTSFPRLRPADAHALAEQYLSDSGSVRPALSHSEQIYPPIGGQRATESHLRDVRTSVMKAIEDAKECSSENPPSQSGLRWEAYFDSFVGLALHRELRMCRSEAAVAGVWSWITLVLLPDVISIRSPKTENVNRLIGGIKNMFSTTWWPVEVLGPSLIDSASRLSVDEVVGLFERRAGISRYNDLAIAYARAVQESSPAGRMEGTREFAKQVRRVGVHVSWPVADLSCLQGMFQQAESKASKTATTGAASAKILDLEGPVQAQVLIGTHSVDIQIPRSASPLQPTGELNWRAFQCPSSKELPSAIVIGGESFVMKRNGSSKRGHPRMQCVAKLSNGVSLSATVIRRPRDLYVCCKLG